MIEMIDPPRKSIVLVASLLLALAGALAASLRLRSPTPANDGSINLKPTNQSSSAIPQQERSPAAPEVIGPIDRMVIAGGGGTSIGGTSRVHATIRHPPDAP